MFLWLKVSTVLSNVVVFYSNLQSVKADVYVLLKPSFGFSFHFRAVPVSPDQLLLRGAQLRNTQWVYGELL